MTAPSEVEFSPLQVVKKNLVDAHRSSYRVYKSPSEYVTVEAATALEAFRESGIKSPVRIVREIRFMDRMLDGSRFSDDDDVVSTADGQGERASADTSLDAQEEIVVPHSHRASASEPQMAALERVEVQQEELQGEEEEETLSPEDVAALLGNGAQTG